MNRTTTRRAADLLTTHPVRKGHDRKEVAP